MWMPYELYKHALYVVECCHVQGSLSRGIDPCMYCLLLRATEREAQREFSMIPAGSEARQEQVAPEPQATRR
jgi:hypothetical protein